ncbi:hypothetical protein [Oleiharenicola lentus]|uniref:hypothetical protein n=1 Tax=Oleiharenicola lentus TaxID=2508720 RepID=UPI003F67DC11
MIKKILLAFSFISLAFSAFAHGDKKVAGPNGGRIFESVTPHVEFFVTPERKIQFTFLDENNQAIAPGAQSVTVTTGDRTNPVTLTFTRQGNVLLSDTALPAGKNLPAVIQLKLTPESAPVIEKFNVNLSTYSECQHAEYACTCGH